MGTYVSLGWDAETPLSARNMNHMEGMAAACKSFIDEHGHYIHYTKVQSDGTFFPQASGMDADEVDGYHALDLVGNQAPLGLILMHKGSDAEFSNGYLISDTRWHICDGGTYNGIITSDTRGYFPKCPSTSSGTGTGGAASVILSGTVTFGSHTLTVAEIPSHYHDWIDTYYWNEAPAPYGGGAFDAGLVSPTPTETTLYNHDAADEAHGHGTQNLNLNSINLTPLWKGYYFICKVK
jgi:hypothetical protein